MKVVMPDGKQIYLEGGKSYEERKQIVDDLCKQYDEYFSFHFESKKVQTCLDMLTSYMARAKEFKPRQNGVLGSLKARRLYGGGEYDPYNILFDDLPRKDKIQLGLNDKNFV